MNKLLRKIDQQILTPFFPTWVVELIVGCTFGLLVGIVIGAIATFAYLDIAMLWSFWPRMLGGLFAGAIFIGLRMKP